MEEGVNAIEAEPAPLRRPVAENLDSRIWFFCPVRFNSESFLRLRKTILRRLVNYPGLEHRTVHFAIVDDSGLLDETAKDLATLPNTVLVRTLDVMGPDHCLVFGLRVLRGTIREEDIIITLDPEKPDHEKHLDLILKPILEDYYDPKKLVVVEAKAPMIGAVEPAVTFAGFFGWFVQFLLKREAFDLGLKNGLYAVDASRKIVSARDARRLIRLATKEERRAAGILLKPVATPRPSWVSLFLARFGVPILMFTFGIVFLIILITPSYASILGRLLAY